MHTSHRPLIIGHRGAPGYVPEHTESSYRLALSQGIDAVEPDVVPTKDGVLVVRHENEISTTTDVAARDEFRDRKTTKRVDGERLTGWFTEDFTWEELQRVRAVERLRLIRRENREHDGREPVLRLADVLRLVAEAPPSELTGEPMRIVIEIKHADYFERLGFDWAQMLAREFELAGWGAPDASEHRGRIIYECFEIGVLDELQRRGFTGTFIFLLESKGSPADEVARDGAEARTFAWYRTSEGLDSLVSRVDGISVAKRDLFERGRFGVARGVNDLIERAHARDLRVFTWTLRPENIFLNQRFRIGANPSGWGDWRSEFDMLVAAGIDGVFLDHPDLGVSALTSTLETT